MIFLLDHSFSMTEPISGSKRSKRDALSVAINRFIRELLLKCQPRGEVLHYFDVAVISYTTDKKGVPVIGSALKGPLAGRELVSSVELEQSPLRFDDKIKNVDDGEGGLTQVVSREQIWYESPPDGEMAGTPMCAAFAYVTRIAQEWAGSHQHCFPPVIIHITDGEANDGSPEAVEAAADQIRALTTSDGSALLFNCHLSKLQAMGVIFPVNEAELPADQYAHLLFRISSVVPDSLRKSAEANQILFEAGARGMAFNADSAGMLMLITSGTIPNKDVVASSMADTGSDMGADEIEGFGAPSDEAPVSFEVDESEPRPEHLV